MSKRRGVAVNKNFGRTHIKAARDTGGSFYSIVSSFDSILKNIGETTSKMATRFKIQNKLSPEELQNIKLRINGIEVPSTEWTFHAESNSISFNEEFSLAPESKVEILFVKPISQFPLKKKLDTSLLDTIDIEINGKVIAREAWEYDEGGNSIKFSDDYVPSVGSKIKIVYNKVSQFTLDKKLHSSVLDTIDIVVNGTTVPREHWQYDESHNSIKFLDGHIPPVGSKVKIIYTNLPQFKLERQIDTSLLDTIEITVNGKLVPREHWQYDEESNSIQFFRGHLPPVGSKIKIIYTDKF